MHLTIRETGLTEPAITDSFKEFQKNDLDWESGRTFGFVYYPGPESARVLINAYTAFFFENGLNPSVFKSLRRMECEVVSMIASLLNAPEEAVGNMTTGGTESIICAMKAARGFYEKNGLANVVMSETAHPAFNKAAGFLGVEVRAAACDEENHVSNAADLEALVDENTIMLVGSAPCFPNGLIDPLDELNQLALKKNVWLHIDACLGGFMLPFLEQLGEPIPPFDFRLPAVRSISVDIHKYGYGPKGSSVILYRNSTLRKKQYFVFTGWPGGIYASPSVAGTRSGGAIAASWAIMNYLGMKGYREKNRESLSAARKIQRAINQTEELKIVGNPPGTVYSFVSAGKIDIYELADELLTKGWHLDKQMNPASLHMTVSVGNLPYIDEFIADLKASVKKLKLRFIRRISHRLRNKLLNKAVLLLPPKLVEKFGVKAITNSQKSKRKKEHSAPVYGMMGALSGSDTLNEIILNFLDSVYKLDED